MLRSDRIQSNESLGPAKDWAELGRRILDVSRKATAMHLASVHRRIEDGGAAKDSPRVVRGG